EELGDIPDVTAANIDRILSNDGFGKFAILSASETSFIQAACDWSPSDDCKDFMQRHGSDPWLLEYRDNDSGRLFRATGHLSLEQVREAFQTYLGCEREWRQRFE